MQGRTVVCANIGKAPSGFEELWVLLSGRPLEVHFCPKGHDPSNADPRTLKGPEQQPIWRAQKRSGPLGWLFRDLKCFTRMRWLAGWRDHWPDPGGCSGAEGDRFDEGFPLRG